MAEKKNKDGIFQAIKFALFSASAGIIQTVSFTLMNEVVVPAINVQNETLQSILQAKYGVCYLIALTLSVLWNFTFNRKFTFKSANNIKTAMLKVFGFYCVFTPVSVILGELVMKTTTWDFAEYVVLGVTMITNMVTEFLFCKFVVYKDEEKSGKTEDESKKEAFKA